MLAPLLSENLGIGTHTEQKNELQDRDSKRPTTFLPIQSNTRLENCPGQSSLIVLLLTRKRHGKSPTAIPVHTAMESITVVESNDTGAFDFTRT